MRLITSALVLLGALLSAASIATPTTYNIKVGSESHPVKPGGPGGVGAPQKLDPYMRNPAATTVNPADEIQFSSTVGANVVSLTDNDFDALTAWRSPSGDSAAASSSTGDRKNWVLAFTAPWCGHCKTLKPILSDLADSLKNRGVNVAEISSQSSPGLLARFSISSYPTIYFLAQPAAAVADSTAANVTAAGADAYAAPPRALVYEYPDSSARSLPALTAFALGGYSAGAAAGKPVPAAPGFLAQLSAELQHAYDDIADMIVARPDLSLFFVLTGVVFGVILATLIFTHCVAAHHAKELGTASAHGAGARAIRRPPPPAATAAAAAVPRKKTD